MTFLVVYWDGDNLKISVVNNAINLQLHDKFFL